jgi:hypothetical protein
MTRAGALTVNFPRPLVGFNSLMVVLFDPEYLVRKAALIPREVVEQVGRYVGHTNSNTVFAIDDLLSDGEDWTQRLRDCVLYHALRDES